MNILVAAFDWGLGHTTRIVPVIQKQLDEGNNFVIVASPKQLPIYNEHFPKIEKIILPSVSPKLSRGNNQVLAIIRYLPQFFLSVYTDRKMAQKLAALYKIDRIISDNRYGFRSGTTYNILITHQINIQVPRRIKFMQPIVQRCIRFYINKFDECHVPDFNPPYNLSGALSNPLPKPGYKVKFIGILSRLQNVVEEDLGHGKYPEMLIILSGPENQRTQFENILLREISKTSSLPGYLIIRGKPGYIKNEIANSINHIDAPKLKSLIRHAKYIICRAGYSTIMDLMYMEKTALLVPTPGQTEQEYLAGYLQERSLFLMEKQANLDLKNCLSRLGKFNRAEVHPANETISI